MSHFGSPPREHARIAKRSILGAKAYERAFARSLKAGGCWRSLANLEMWRYYIGLANADVSHAPKREAVRMGSYLAGAVTRANNAANKFARRCMRK